MKKRLPFFAFLLLYLVFSFVTFRDYGCTWDEQDTYQGGAEIYQYLVHGVPMSYMDPEHSYPYTFLLSFITGPSNYGLLHLLNLLFAGFLFWAAYEILLVDYGALWAVAGPAFLFLFLPFLGSIPANPKDIPFAIFYFLGLAVLYLYRRKFPEGKFGWFFLGLLAGLAISSRIVGFTLFPVMVFYDLYVLWSSWGKKKPKNPPRWFGKAWGWLGAFGVSQILCALLWPFIGQDYFRNLPTVFWLSARFPPKFSFLFMGGMSDSLTYPWYYLPLWIAITTPLFILVFFAGSFFLAKAFKSKPLFTLMATAFLLNLGFYFLLHPAIYDGLRHFLFLLPMMSVLASMVFIEFFRKKSWGPGRKAAAGLAALGVILTLSDMARLHPYEYAYFNELVGGFKGAYGKYETDYWVASFREAVAWLCSNEMKDPGRKYKVFPGADPPPPQARIYTDSRLEYVTDRKNADYAIVITRAGLKPDPDEEGKVIHRVEREGAPLSFILKLR